MRRRSVCPGKMFSNWALTSGPTSKQHNPMPGPTEASRSAAFEPNSVARMESEFGSKAADLLASVGPGIGLCCFEVGPEVSAQFENIFPGQTDLRRIDLAKANRRHLEAAGFSARNIEISGLCTMCGADEFHSFRRDKDLSGRLVSGASIRNEKSAG